ncbi:lysine--tRNA ligase [Polluticaenibacter yanchengensis]|uniref:Lysine--tRNA ligase n=1 Tax=Polluticaenibacter yanchengensis TaxID=3014562 RepID=A0ABT4UN31_9BACT|nr:lysine--tRNA ligase [Chitinophagaceae bacterium LY-5]
MSQQLSEQEIIRRQKLDALKEQGIEPYPAPLYPVNNYSADIKNGYTEERKEEYADVCVAGRVMSINDKGKVFFIKIQDSKGIFQLYVKRDEICPEEDKSYFDNLVKRGLDLGDFIGATGYAFITKTGEVSLHTKTITLLAKSLKPLPVVKRLDDGTAFDEVSDPEFKYRQRYADLIVNPSIKETFIKRTKLVNTIRDFLNGQGAIEVDTPVLQSIPGGAAARPFITHHNALDVPFYLRIANELYLKRLVVGGFDWVYEFSRNFRNEGMDRTHNPEFTVLEWYTAYKDYFWMMEVTEQLFEKIAIALHGTTEVPVGDKIINFKAPFKRISIHDAIKENSGFDVSNLDEAGLRDVCKQLKIDVPPTIGKGKLIDEIFGATSEHTYTQPTFIIDYPIEMSPLTKKHRSKEGLVERFELMVNGKEIANAYSELNDPIDQRERFEEQIKLMERGDDEAMFIDYDFLRALEYGMPPTSGIGIGIDRLVMLMTNQPSIQDVLFFPQMRPEVWDNK